MTSQDRTTAFFALQGWQVPWSRIELLQDGWPLAAGRLLCRSAVATTIAIGSRYIIGYRAGASEACIAHELTHVWQMERVGLAAYVARYAWELVTRGYARIGWEVEAERVEQQFGDSE